MKLLKMIYQKSSALCEPRMMNSFSLWQHIAVQNSPSCCRRPMSIADWERIWGWAAFLGVNALLAAIFLLILFAGIYVAFNKKHPRLIAVHHTSMANAIQYIESVGNSKDYEFIQLIESERITLWYHAKG
jgi:hypothetical protein